MTDTEKDELLKLAKSLAKSVTCSGTIAAKAVSAANDILKSKLDGLNTDKTNLIREEIVFLGYRPQAEYAAFLAYVIGHLFGCLTLYRPKTNGEFVGTARQVRFVGMGANPELAGYLYYELWQRLKRERQAFVNTTPGRRRNKTRVEREGDDYALSQVNRIRRWLESFMTSHESEIEVLQGYIQAWHLCRNNIPLCPRHL